MWLSTHPVSAGEIIWTGGQLQRPAVVSYVPAPAKPAVAIALSRKAWHSVSVQPAACPSTRAAQAAKPAKLARKRMGRAVRNLAGDHKHAAREPGAALLRRTQLLWGVGMPEAAPLAAKQVRGTQWSDSRGLRRSTV
jgi:hypothetical protein